MCRFKILSFFLFLGFPMRFNKIDELLSFKVEAEVFESELLAVLKEPDISRPTYDNLLNKVRQLMCLLIVIYLKISSFSSK